MNRFVFVTDSHYWRNAPKDYGAPKMLTKGREIHDALVPAVNTLAPEFIVHGGDFLCGGSAFDLPTDILCQSVQDVRDSFDGFAAEFYPVTGNHDCDAQTWKFDVFHEAFGASEPIAVDRVASDLHILRANVFLGDTKEKGSGEWTDAHDTHLREADRQALADRTPTVLFLHSWILPNATPEEGTEGRGCVEGARRLLETVSECLSIVAVFTGHMHINRITAYRDFLIVDTACLIGYPFGFREVTLSDDGWFTTRFHRLDVPIAMEAYRSREDASEDGHWEGQPHDCDCDVLIPRLKAIRA